MKSPPQISDAEWEVMSVIWDSAPISTNEVVERLSLQKDWQPSTIRTMLQRLVKKGVLANEQEGKQYFYRPTVSREKCVRLESQSFLSRVFGGEATPLLVHFVKSAKLTPPDIQELKRTLTEKEKSS